jgi:hypothetical protein
MCQNAQHAFQPFAPTKLLKSKPNLAPNTKLNKQPLPKKLVYSSLPQVLTEQKQARRRKQQNRKERLV